MATRRPGQLVPMSKGHGNGLPCSLDAERFVLGAILIDDEAYAEALAHLKPEHFSTEAHRRILRRTSDLYGREERINRVTLYEELARHGEAESVGGISYLVDLIEGIPLVPSLDSSIRILDEKAALRKVLFACDNLMSRVELGESSAEISKAAGELFAGIGAGVQSQTIVGIPAVSESGAAVVEYLRNPELPKGAVVALTGDAGCGKSTLAAAWARDAITQGVPTLILDRENPRAVVAERNERIGLADGPLYRHWGGWMPQEAPQPDAPAVMDWVRLSAPRPLVVVDSFSAFGPMDQNDAGECRAFMHRCRRAADLGATVLLMHNDGKAESARDYRGSSDFKAAVDLAFHVSNFGLDGLLDRLVLRPFKTRFPGFSGELVYSYARGRLERGETGEARQSVSEQLTALLRLNPGVTAKTFEDLAHERGLGRNRARAFLGEGITSKGIRFEPASKGGKRYFVAGMEAQSAF
jgi:hypothetical protein